MRRGPLVVLAGLAVTAVLAGWWWHARPTGPAEQAPDTVTMPQPEDTETWRARRLATLQAPDGWLSVAGLFFPEPGRNRIGTDPASEIRLPEGSAPALVGHVTEQDGRLWLELAPGVDGSIEGAPIRGRVEMRPADAEGDRSADRVQIGRLTLQAHRSGQRLGIRLRDPESPIRTNFAGMRWYPIDPRWRIEGRFVAYDEPRTLPIQNVLGDLVDEPTPGEVEFDAGGETLRMVAIDAGKRLWFVFRDATAERDTYSTRFLYADKPDARGVVVLDFNRAYNPPCAFNPHTTCPLPPRQNRLSIAIEAGELNYEGPSEPGARPAVTSGP